MLWSFPWQFLGSVVHVYMSFLLESETTATQCSLHVMFRSREEFQRKWYFFGPRWFLIYYFLWKSLHADFLTVLGKLELDTSQLQSPKKWLLTNFSTWLLNLSTCIWKSSFIPACGIWTFPSLLFRPWFNITAGAISVPDTSKRSCREASSPTSAPILTGTLYSLNFCI